LEGAFEDVLGFLLGEGATHPPLRNLPIQVFLYGLGVAASRRVVREDDGLGEWGKFPHGEAMEEVADKEGVVIGDIMLVKKFQKGGGIIRGFYTGKDLFMVTGSYNGRWA
jgi:hypothetical protein